MDGEFSDHCFADQFPAGESDPVTLYDLAVSNPTFSDSSSSVSLRSSFSSHVSLSQSSDNNLHSLSPDRANDLLNEIKFDSLDANSTIMLIRNDVLNSNVPVYVRTSHDNRVAKENATLLIEFVDNIGPFSRRKFSTSRIFPECLVTTFYSPDSLFQETKAYLKRKSIKFEMAEYYRLLDRIKTSDNDTDRRPITLDDLKEFWSNFFIEDKTYGTFGCFLEGKDKSVYPVFTTFTYDELKEFLKHPRIEQSKKKKTLNDLIRVPPSSNSKKAPVDALSNWNLDVNSRNSVGQIVDNPHAEFAFGPKFNPMTMPYAPTFNASYGMPGITRSIFHEEFPERFEIHTQFGYVHDKSYNEMPGMLEEYYIQSCKIIDEFRYAVNEVICSGNPDDQIQVWHWILQVVCGERKPDKMLILFSPEQGIGKTVFGHILGRIIGPNRYTESVNNDFISGKFNRPLLEGQLLIQLDELTEKITKSLLEILKELITANSILPERKSKNVKKTHRFNHTASFLLTTNKLDPAYMGYLKERRFLMVQPKGGNGDRMYALKKMIDANPYAVQELRIFLMSLYEMNIFPDELLENLNTTIVDTCHRIEQLETAPKFVHKKIFQNRPVPFDLDTDTIKIAFEHIFFIYNPPNRDASHDDDLEKIGMFLNKLVNHKSDKQVILYQRDRNKWSSVVEICSLQQLKRNFCDIMKFNFDYYDTLLQDQGTSNVNEEVGKKRKIDETKKFETSMKEAQKKSRQKRVKSFKDETTKYDKSNLDLNNLKTVFTIKKTKNLFDLGFKKTQ